MQTSEPMSQKVLITDSIAPVCAMLLTEQGIEVDIRLKQSPEALAEIVDQYHGWIIRSGTRINADLLEAAKQLRVVGRAGVGVDNVDLEAATKRGVLVLNAPDGNTISTAEHTCAMLLALSRHISQADASLTEKKWERKKFMGAEVYGKTLGIIGVGKIGRAVAQRMQGFGMHTIGFDPVLSEETAEKMGIELVPLDEVYARSDYITTHTPLNDATRGMLNRDTLRQCKPGIRLVNCARGGIIDEGDLLDAIEAGHVAGAALDVYSQEPPGAALASLVSHPRVVTTPHIAASTEEAQEKVARQVTEQVINALQGRPVQTPVNSMAIKMAAQHEVQPYLRLAEILGSALSQLSEGSMRRLTVRCCGELTQRYAEILTIGALKGILDRWHTEPVNYINARTLAEQAGLQIEVRLLPSAGNFTNLLDITLESDQRSRRIAGAVFGREDVRIVQVDGYDFEVHPHGCILFYANKDRPGMLAAVGHRLAQAEINIGALALGRKGPGSIALTAVSVDQEIPQHVLDDIAQIEDVDDIKVVYL